MAYVPVNIPAFVASYSGAIAGMAVSGWIVDPTAVDYSLVCQIAGAFAQSFDTVWNNAAPLNNLEIAAISSIVSEDFSKRGPGPLSSARFVTPANWTQAAAACAALVLQSDAYFAGQGINPGTGGGGGGAVTSVFGRVAAVVAALGDYSAQLISYAGAVPAVTQVKAALDSLQAQISALPAAPVASVFGRFGAIAAVLGDYSAQLISYAGAVPAVTQVKAALDSLQAQISALPPGGVAPLQVVESASTAFWDIAGAAIDFVRKQNGGAPIQCAFAAWNAGDILYVTAQINAAIFGAPAPCSATFSVLVSLDGGATFQKLTPALGSFDVGDPAPAAGVAQFSVFMAGSVALASTPIVRIEDFQHTGHLEVDFENGCGVFLRCERYAAGAYVPSGTLF